MLEKSPPQHFNIEPAAIADLSANDQAIVTALIMTNETVSVEEIGGIYKLLVNLRAQALFFDYKSMTIMRAYPISVAMLDVLDHPPTEAETSARVRLLLIGGPDAGLLSRYVQRLDEASLPSAATRFVQVSKVTVAEAARALLPQKLAAPGAAETWVADTFGEALSSQAGIPVLPYAKGYAIGHVMETQFSDGSIFNLKIPEADYAISVDVTGLKRVLFGESAAGSSFIYASYAQVKMEEPLSGTVFFDSPLKNGETKAVPAMQQSVDDAPAYLDSLRGLFTRTATVFGGTNLPWLKAAAGGADIDKQLSATRTVIQQCK
ncbi:MAG: hypothetical protein ACRYGG_14840 [Janthinobacterium lividum]